MGLLGYHLLTDDFRPIPWACTDGAPLTEEEARNVLDSGHDKCNPPCAIAKTARKTLAKAAKNLAKAGKK